MTMAKKYGSVELLNEEKDYGSVELLSKQPTEITEIKPLSVYGSVEMLSQPQTAKMYGSV